MKLQYSELKFMYFRSLNTVKWSTCTQEASIQWNEDMYFNPLYAVICNIVVGILCKHAWFISHA